MVLLLNIYTFHMSWCIFLLFPRVGSSRLAQKSTLFHPQNSISEAEINLLDFNHFTLRNELNSQAAQEK